MNVDQVPSIELIIYSAIFLYWEIHRQTHKCITIKAREKEIDFFVQDNF